MIDRRTPSHRYRIVLLAVLLAWTSGLVATDSKAAEPRSHPVGDRQLCERCHADLADVLGGSVVHLPVTADTCTSCHNPHASRHGNLLRETSRTLCLSCHVDTAEEVRAGVLHGALRGESACLTCHEAHASNHGALLSADEFSVCTNCHEPIRAKAAQANPHAPVAAGDCSSCHEPHAGVDIGLLDQPVPGLCFGCHEAGSQLERSHAGFDLTGVDCRSCHDAHGTRSAKLVRDAVHAVFDADSCDTCHASARDPGVLQIEQPELCTTCHDQWSEAAPHTQHPSGEEVPCTRCHSPHAGEPPAMLRGAERPLCLGCHADVRSAIDEAVSFHPLDADEGRCTACHGLHDAAERPLLARSADQLCADCHTDHSRFAHPMGTNVPDPLRPGHDLDCLSCHEAHASQHKMLLKASPDRDLCVGCHANLH